MRRKALARLSSSLPANKSHNFPTTLRKRGKGAHPGNSEVPEHTPRNPTSHTSILDLRRPRVGVHLGELELGLSAHTLRETRVADDITKSLPG